MSETKPVKIKKKIHLGRMSLFFNLAWIAIVFLITCIEPTLDELVGNILIGAFAFCFIIGQILYVIILRRQSGLSFVIAGLPYAFVLFFFLVTYLTGGA